jgi:hypothetical protein
MLIVGFAADPLAALILDFEPGIPARAKLGPNGERLPR